MNASQGDELTSKTRLEEITKCLLSKFRLWQVFHKRGQTVCHCIEAIKTKCFASNPGGTLFPEELRSYCEKLANILSEFEDIVNNAQASLRQMEAVVELMDMPEDAVYKSWMAVDFLEFTKRILDRYRSELDVKKFVAEEIAHCEDRSDLVRIASLWEYPRHMDDNVRLMFMHLAQEISAN